LSWWWTSTQDGRIVLLAAAFGLGPRIAAVNLAQTLDLKIKPWNLGGPRFQELQASGDRVLLNFGVVDTEAARLCTEKRIWIDCLMWLRSRLPQTVLDYDLILAEEFFALGECFKQRNLTRIQPLISSPLSRDPRNHLILISFGGIETPFTRDTHRLDLPLAILTALARSAKRNLSYAHLVCFAPDSTLHRLQRDPRLGAVTFRPLDREVFLETLAVADLYVVQPGLYGPFEAFAASIPTAICMPMSYTQMWQAEAYLKHGLLEPNALFDRVRLAVEPIGREIEAEEHVWFERVNIWWQETLRSDHKRREVESELEMWADQVTRKELPSTEVREARRHHIDSIKQLPSASEILCDVVPR
jgi:hypothetical protein